MIRAVLFDLDGVVRHFDRDTDLERRHGLPEGAITQAALSAPLLDDVPGLPGGAALRGAVGSVGGIVGGLPSGVSKVLGRLRP